MCLNSGENDNGQNFSLKILFYRGRMTEGIIFYAAVQINNSCFILKKKLYDI